MIKISDNKYPTYEHICDPGYHMNDTVDCIYDQYNIWGKQYDGWTMLMDFGQDYLNGIQINFCPFCGEKLSIHQPQEPDRD